MARVIKDDRGRLYGANFGFAGINTLTDPISIPIESGQCVDIVNCDIDDEHNASRRDGYVLIAAGAITSAWSNGATTYCIQNARICTFNGATVTTLDPALVVGANCEFEQVNNVVVFSDGSIIGIIDGGAVTRIDTPADWVSVATLEQWVTDHYPADPAKWNGITSNSNFTVDAFKLSTMAGKCLCFYNGALYLAVDNFVYCTKTFDIAHMDIRYSVVAGFPDPVTMINRVQDGLFVGTTKGVHFLPGSGIVADEKGTFSGGFNQVRVSEYGVFYGSDVRVDSEQVLAVKQAAGTVAMFSTPVGVMVGTNGGSVYNLSSDKMTFGYDPVTVKAPAIFKSKNGRYQYIAALDNGYTLVVNTNNGDHSRYTNFTFNSMFGLAGEYYGATAAGIHKITGDTDPTAVAISAYVVTPSLDFDSRKQKTATILYLQGRCSGGMVINIYANEGAASENLTITFDTATGMHRRRVKAPKGIKGTNLQFKVSNVAGASFAIADLEVAIVELQRTT